MTNMRWNVGSLLLVLALLASEVHGQPLTSGLQVGQRPDTFFVRDCTGPAAGKTLCYFCRYGGRPVVTVFVREINEQVADLAKQLDQIVADHREQRMAAFLVVVTDDSVSAERQ